MSVITHKMVALANLAISESSPDPERCNAAQQLARLISQATAAPEAAGEMTDAQIIETVARMVARVKNPIFIAQLLGKLMGKIER